MGETLYPLKFHEIFKEKPWGSDALRSVCMKNIPPGARIGESWEVADLGQDVSVVKGGAFAGTSLRELARRFPDRVIGGTRHGGQVPLLFKLIATGEPLSIQVHPDDQYASKRVPGACGKMEAWHILHADPGSWIVLGFSRLTDRIELEGLLASGQIESVLHRVPVKAGETYLIRPGILHCIGPGVVLAEIQQSSDITYRLHDWGR
jgi:mannose-6-phosphate isomerase